jgi:uncharacterized protein YdeI (YjbR/CyaY-like superfamily)
VPARQACDAPRVKPRFFAKPAAFRAWLEKHHDTHSELLVGFHKRGSGKPSITWPESVDAALSFGWIDGVRKRLDDDSYTIRFTPRKPRSIWSAVNIKRVQALTADALMHPAGIAAFEARIEAKSGIYAYEQRSDAKLSDEYERRFRLNKKAWAFFSAQAPWYRRNATWWVISAKREDTREKRLATLIEDSAAGRTIARLTPPGATL